MPNLISKDEHEEAEEDDEAEMKKHMEVVQDDEEIAIDAIPLATKPPIIVEYKIVKEGQKGFYHLIRADGSSNRYSSMIRMLQNISREDLETLWKLVKTKHGNTRPEDVYEKVFWGDLKVMFEPDIKSEIWRSLQGYKVTVWKLFDSSGVHFVRFKNLHIFMLVEKRYPLTPITITNMLNKKLQADYWNEMCYQLLKLMIQKMNIKFRGGLLGLKDFKMILRVTTAQIYSLGSIRFGGNAATKKTQRNLLKQQYENFTAPSLEMLDQTFDRLLSQLELLDEKLSQEDRNRADLDTMSMDDLYNNLKAYEPEVKGLSSSRRKLTENGNETLRFDKYKVECYNYHKREHFCRKCRAPRNQDYKKQESTRRSVLVKTSNSTALVSCDGLGLESVEERLDFFKKNESIYLEDIKGLKVEIHIGEITIRELRKKLEKVQKEKDGIQLHVDKFEHASESLNKLIDCHIVDNCKKGLGYNAVPPPYTRNFVPPTPNLSFIGLDEFTNEPTAENSKANSNEEVPNVVRNCNDAPIIEDWVLDDEEYNED
ncbi:hypothetical protein Tco_0024703 [Tanacetum coccineum]